mmetsp:Transcript_84790/g.168386  ORF Transcript_84790/g.168386 Transcript_84790/m.168386 type:complete len:87 (-) Transcript_84790:173-433(-)
MEDLTGQETLACHTGEAKRLRELANAKKTMKKMPPQSEAASKTTDGAQQSSTGPDTAKADQGKANGNGSDTTKTDQDKPNDGVDAK